MGLFDKLKGIFNKKETDEFGNVNKTEEVIEKYEEGLTKTRENFVSKLNLLGIKFTKIDEAFYEELEEILIMADIGVKTTSVFMDKLKGKFTIIK